MILIVVLNGVRAEVAQIARNSLDESLIMRAVLRVRHIVKIESVTVECTHIVDCGLKPAVQLVVLFVVGKLTDCRHFYAFARIDCDVKFLNGLISLDNLVIVLALRVNVNDFAVIDTESPLFDFELIRSCRRDDAFSHLFVALVHPHPRRIVKHEIFDLEVFEVVVKPRIFPRHDFAACFVKHRDELLVVHKTYADLIGFSVDVSVINTCLDTCVGIFVFGKPVGAVHCGSDRYGIRSEICTEHIRFVHVDIVVTFESDSVVVEYGKHLCRKFRSCGNRYRSLRKAI